MMTEEKLKELLLKIRKGATASLASWSQLGQVLAVLDPGWKLEPNIGLVKLHGHTDPEAPQWFSSEDETEVKQRHDYYSQFAVTSLPTNPKNGQLYVLALTKIQERKQAYSDKTEWTFDFKPWIGHEGWKVETPAGEVFNALPGQYDVPFNRSTGVWGIKKRTDIRLYGVVPWLNKNTDWINQINNKLNMAPHEPGVPRTREHTGSCPVCFQNIKLSNEKMVLHGYRRPGTGTVHGSCFGVGYPAFELSVKGTKAYREVVENQTDSTERYLKKLKSDEVESLNTGYRETKVISKGEPGWERALKQAIDSEERNLKSLKETLQDYTNLVTHWKIRPLPKEGEFHIDWYYKGQKPSSSP
jgi:hypothetical protein